MHALCTAIVATVALAMGCGNALAHGDHMRLALVQLYSTSDESGSGGAPRDVEPGETFMVTGECISDEYDEIRVVLSLADRTDAHTGFHAMLATEQSREDGTLRVRVPNLREARNHVFRVRLFVGADEPRVCDAGSIRVG